MRSQEIFPAEPARGWIPWGALAPFLALAFVIATALTGDWLIAKHVNMSPEGNPLDPTALIAFTLVPFGLLLLVLLAWVRFVERRPVESIGICGERKLRDFLRGHAIGLAGLVWSRHGDLDSRWAAVHGGGAGVLAARVPGADRTVAVHIRAAVQRRRTAVPWMAAVGALEEIQRAHCRRRQLGAVFADALQPAHALAGIGRHVPVCDCLAARGC